LIGIPVYVKETPDKKGMCIDVITESVIALNNYKNTLNHLLRV
jgi:hypothetical protein